jgi:competence protein ComEC
MAGADAGLKGLCLAVAWLLGMAAHLQQAELPNVGVHAALLVAGLFLLAACVRRTRWSMPAGALGAALAAFALAGLQAHARLAQRLDAALEGQDIVVTGVVSSLPQRSADGWRFRFAVEQAQLRGTPVHLPETVSLGWYAGYADEPELTAAQSSLRAGQRWRFTVRLKQPHGSLNPQGFDAELWLFEQGIGANGYVRASRDAIARKLADDAGAPIERARQHVRDALLAHVSDARAGGVLAALTVGEQAAIDHDDWDVFRQTGVAHLMSISGLHITMFAWLAGLGCRALWRRSAWLMLKAPAPLAARWGGLAAAAAYALFSGWGVPSQRTVYMLASVTLLMQLGVRWPWPLVLLSAAVLVSALDPWALLQPGFWLSFVAVGVLMASSPVSKDHPRSAFGAPPHRGAASGPAEPDPRRPLGFGWFGRAVWPGVRDGLRTQAVATVGLTPLSLVFFQQVSLVGFAANLLAIPLVTLVVTPLALLGVLWSPLWSVAALCVQGLNAYLAWLLTMPGAVWGAAVAPAWAQAAGLIGGALLMLPLPWRLRLLAVPLLLPLLWPPLPRPAFGHFELIAADIGQGTAVLVRTRHQTLLYDAGPQYGRDSDAGQRVLLPLLRTLGEQRLQRIVLSHRDTDHVGGAAALLHTLPVGELDSSLEDRHPLLALASANNVTTQRCSAGQAWQADGVRFTVLRPEAADYERPMKSNAMSCVVRVEGSAQSALLTGDMEAEQERALLANVPGGALRSDVLLVPHHGSRTSSTAALLDAVRPRVAVVQAGYRNRFGHPAPDVMARYAERGIDVVRSDRCGAWRWAADGAMSCERQLSRRYWHHVSGQ